MRHPHQIDSRREFLFPGIEAAVKPWQAGIDAGLGYEALRVRKALARILVVSDGLPFRPFVT